MVRCSVGTIAWRSHVQRWREWTHAGLSSSNQPHVANRVSFTIVGRHHDLDYHTIMRSAAHDYRREKSLLSSSHTSRKTTEWMNEGAMIASSWWFWMDQTKISVRTSSYIHIVYIYILRLSINQYYWIIWLRAPHLIHPPWHKIAMSTPPPYCSSCALQCNDGRLYSHSYDSTRIPSQEKWNFLQKQLQTWRRRVIKSQGGTLLADHVKRSSALRGVFVKKWETSDILSWA